MNSNNGRWFGFSSLLLSLLLVLPSLTAASSSCSMDTYLTLQARWASPDEACQQKLSFDLWVVMKAEGTAADVDAQHVLAECMKSPDVSALTLKVVEGWEYVPSSDDCGHVVDSIPKSAAFACKNVGDLEGTIRTTHGHDLDVKRSNLAICTDEGILHASRALRSVAGDHNLRGRGPAPTKIDQPPRRLQTTVSEAGRAHEVDALVAGLEALGCENTRGDGQTLCIMSDSYNRLGNAASLEASGDLPPNVEIVKELPSESTGTDEGSAMMELAYDIAPNANYKFNTAAVSPDIFAADIGVLAATNDCDVIVDDIGWTTSPAFRDGVISLAVDDAVDTHDILYFTSAGNDGLGLRFTSSIECLAAIPETDTFAPCAGGDDNPLYIHVFDDTREDFFRYLVEVTPFAESSLAILSWDEDDGAARNIIMSLWTYDGATRQLEIFEDVFADGIASEIIEFPLPVVGITYYVGVHQLVDPAVAPDVAMQLVGIGANIAGATGSSIYGQPCAGKATTVGAINWDQASGTNGAFADPETSPVEEFSSRGGCTVRTNGVLEDRSKPVTTAADSTSTSTPGFSDFDGTSAAAPVAAAIATLIRAACAPERVVGHDDMTAILTNYDYIIDYTSDVGGIEAYGPEAGYGIMSASKMLAWVSANCAVACPGGTDGGTDAPTPTPSPTRGGDGTDTPTAVTPSPIRGGDVTDTPTAATPSPIRGGDGTDTPTAATPSPTREGDVTGTPTVATPSPIRGGDGTDTPTAATPSPIEGGDGTDTPTAATPSPIEGGDDTDTPTATTPSPIEGGDGTDTPTAVTPSPIRAGDGTIAPTAATPSPTTVEPPVSIDDGDLVEAATKTTVTVTSTGFDERSGAENGDVGCGASGCMPELARDGIFDVEESRWSCQENIVAGKDNCEIKFVFEEAQNIEQLEVAFYLGETRSRKLKLRVNGNVVSTLESADTSGFSTYTVEGTEEIGGVKKLILESVGLDKDEWISILEVRFLVAP